MRKLTTTVMGTLAALPLLAAGASLAPSPTPVGAFVEAWNPGTFVITTATQSAANNAVPMGITFDSNRAGTVVCRGQIRPASGAGNPGWSFMHLDSDDVSVGTVATARIFRSPAGQFSGTCAASLVASVSSTNGTGCHTDFTPLGHAWDFDNFVYWCEVTITRRSADGPNINAFRVALHV